MKVAAMAGAVALLALGVTAAVWPAKQRPAPDPTEHSIWTEVPWPFPLDQWGRGKAFTCAATDCGAKVSIYVRAKIGFCNCTTGVADDEELDRIGDLELLDDKVAAQGVGRPIAVAWMKGRSRSYALTKRAGRSALSIGYNDRCDAIVATVVVQHERPDKVEAAVLAWLNGATVMRWAEITLGL